MPGSVPAILSAWMQPFIADFSEANWRHAVVMVAGALLAPGRRTVTAGLQVMGLGQETGFAVYHRLLSTARWSARAVARRLLLLLVATFAPNGPVVIAIDDTIERRWGARIKARGIYRDPVRSSKGQFVKVSGLRWLCVMLLVPVPWAGGRIWALPFLTVLAPSERYDQERGCRHKALTDWARQSLLQVARWLPGRQIIVVADSSFACLDLLKSIRRQVCVVTRLRLDAALYAPPPDKPGRRGRPAVKGAKLPTLEERLSTTPPADWQRVTLNGWYGDTRKQLDILSDTALWYHSGKPVLPLRWLLVRDPSGKRDPQAFLCTDPQAKIPDILRWFVRRWRAETTFEEARHHLGVETQRQWSDLAILRTTPALLGLFSLVTLWTTQLPTLPAWGCPAGRWYRKPLPTFSDALAAIRHQLWSGQTFALSPTDPDSVKIPLPTLNRLIYMACHTA